MTELTLTEFIEYSRNSLRDKHITKESQVIVHTYDGISTYDFLQEIIKNFNVDFSNFDFSKYFHTEAEISNFGSFKLRRIKERTVEPLTFEGLYDFIINQKAYNINKEKCLSIENLIIYIKNRNLDKDLKENSNIIDRVGDGSDAYYFLKDLEKEFQVSFKNFDFEKYFHRNYELRNNGCLFFWLDKKTREVEELTVKDLYEYMIKHQK